MNGVGDFFKTMGPARLAAMGAVAAILIGVFTVLFMRMSTPQMAPLFSGLAVEDSGAIVRELESAAVPYELRNDGETILVPQEQVARLRMTLAQEGLPSGGGIGYEIFDKGGTLGATSFVQNVNHVRALEGELARSIRGLSQVEAARVHLVLPERRLFAREAQKASASIVLRIRGRLDAGQIKAVQHLVASAIPEMEPTQVSIVDEGGRLLASGRGEEEGIVGSAAEERVLAQERRMRDEVQAIVESVVGAGRARVQVAVEIDRNRMTETAEVFDPESRVIRSTQTSEESSSSNQVEPDGGVTVGEELPNAEAQDPANRSQEEQAKSEEIVNYEISRTTRTEVVEPGRLKRLSVAVLVDGVYEKDPAGELVYAPRAQEQMDRIAALVRSAVGFSAARGDSVEVVNLRFAESPRTEDLDLDAGTGWLGLERADIMRFAELGVLALLLLIVLLTVVRPLMRRMLGEDGAKQALLEGPPGAASAPAPGAAQIAGPPIAMENKTQRMLEIAALSSQMHANSVTKIGDLINGNPDDAVSIVRQWMQEPA